MRTVLLMILIVITFVMSLRKGIYGLCFFLAIRILIPETVRIGNYISYNTLVVLIISVAILVRRRMKTDKFGFLLIGLVLYSAITLPFSNYENFFAQFKFVFQFLITEIIPALIAIMVIENKQDVVLLAKVYAISSIACCIYGLLSYVMIKNPYLVFWVGRDMQGGSIWRGRSTCATFAHANGFGYFIAMSIPCLFYIYNEKIIDTRLAKITLSLFFLMLVLCKKRAAFVTVAIYISLLLLTQLSKTNIKKFKRIILGMIFGGIGVVVILSNSMFGDLKRYLTAAILFWNDSAVKGVSIMELGSSWSMRVGQVIYPFKEIKNNIIFGHGFGWCNYYLSNIRVFHPVLYGFETILARAVCEYGIMGYFVYTFLFSISYKYACAINKNTSYILLYVIAIVTLAIATGFDYQYLFFLTIVFMRKQGVFNK